MARGALLLHFIVFMISFLFADTFPGAFRAALPKEFRNAFPGVFQPNALPKGFQKAFPGVRPPPGFLPPFQLPPAFRKAFMGGLPTPSPSPGPTQSKGTTPDSTGDPSTTVTTPSGSQTTGLISISPHFQPIVEIRQFGAERTGLGGSVRRECVSHDPEWVVYWHLPNGTLYYKPKIELNNVSLRQAGKYTCIAMNRWDGQLATVTFELDYQERWDSLEIRPLRGERFDYGGELRRDCYAGPAGWFVYWRLPNGTYVQGRYLDIRHVGRRQAGRYLCVAKNMMDGRKIIGWIRVFMKRRTRTRIDVMTLPENKVMRGGTLALRCQVNHSNWRVLWVDNHGIRIYGNDLRVTDLGSENRGGYWCIAKDPRTGYNLKAMYRLR